MADTSETAAPAPTQLRPQPGALPALLPALLRMRAEQTPVRIAYTFLRENGSEQDICYAELAARVDALAAHLLRQAAPGARALLFHPAGIDFLVAFFGCLASGVIAVPAAPAHRPRDAGRLAALLADAEPSLVLCAPEVQGATRAALARAACAVPLLADAGAAGPAPAPAPLAAPAPAANAVAFLQYTSGSTGRPKGVEITHANVLANVAAIGSDFGFHPGTVMVSWLPPFHDMGLIGSICAPLALGFRSVLMAPGTFLRRPASWLEAITHYRATCSGGPNFAWDLCLRRIGPAQKAALDLSSLELLYNGAETVRAATLEQFAEAFGRCGLRREALFPCYGMAEATLLVAGGPRGRAPRILALDSAALERGEVREALARQAGSRKLVGCGPAAPGVEVAVVDPARCLALGEDEVGELWIAGPGVARGYHARRQDSAQLFGLRIAAAPDYMAGARWLRSGDLGFVRGGEVYITGRRKDTIVINGRKIHAQDVEALAEGACPELAPNSCAAFALELEAGERLAMVVEAGRALARGGDIEALARRIRAAVTAGAGTPLHTLAFVGPGVFPRTTSGKLQRALCKSLLQKGALPQLAVRTPRDDGSAARADAAIAWLRAYAARRLDSRLADERRSLPPHVLLDFGARGLLGLQAPKRSGGLALATVDLVRVMAQLAAIDLTLATLVGVHNGLGLRPLLRFAPEPLRRQWLPALASGRQLAAYALSEPQAGSNPRAIGSRAARVDGGWRLDGEKHLIGLAAWAGVLTVFARAFDAAGRSLGTVALLVPGDAPGLLLGAEALTMGMRAMPQSEVRFEGVFVPDAQVLGTPGAGMDVAHDAMGFARLGIGALCVGAMKRCFQLMARYAERRDIAGGRLIENPVTTLRLHELDCAIAAAEALVDALAAAIDAGAQLPLEACSACKCVLSELLWEAVDRLMQMLGGRGYLETNLAPQLLRDARVLRILEGPSEALYAHLGALVRLPGNPIAQAVDKYASPALASALGVGLAQLPAPGSGAWQDGRNGEFAAWTLLAATARGEAAPWARRRLDGLARTVHAEQAALAACPPGSALLARVARHALAIGDVEQAAPGEAGRVDPFLRQAAPAPMVEDVPAPQAPSSLELVRNCLQRWRCEGGLGDGSAGSMPDDAALPPLDAGFGDDALLVDIAAGPVAALGGWSVDTPFSDLGIDSLASVPLALEVEQASGVPVSAELLYDYPTVRLLAAYLDEWRGEHRV